MMNETDLYRAVGEIDEDLLQETEKKLFQKPHRRSLQALAACAACALLVGGAALYQHSPNTSISSTAVAESGSQQMTIVSENESSAIIQAVYDLTGIVFVNEDAYEISGHITTDEASAIEISDSDTESETEDEWEADEETLYYAYMDYDSAADEDKEKILAAREEIIWHTSWVAEGYYGYTYDVETGEILDVTPQFYDIFPEDWEIPTTDSYDGTTEETEETEEENEPVLLY